MMLVAWQISRSVRAASSSKETPQSRLAMRKSRGAMPATPSGAFHRKVHKSTPSGSCSGASGQYHGRPNNNLSFGCASRCLSVCAPTEVLLATQEKSKRVTSVDKSFRDVHLTAPLEGYGSLPGALGDVVARLPNPARETRIWFRQEFSRTCGCSVGDGRRTRRRRRHYRPCPLKSVRSVPARSQWKSTSGIARSADAEDAGSYGVGTRIRCSAHSLARYDQPNVHARAYRPS